MNKTRLLVVLNLLIVLPIVCLLSILGTSKPTPMVILPILGLGVWAISLPVILIVALVKHIKSTREQQKPDLSKLKESELFHADAVLFDYPKLVGGSIGWVLLAVILLPFAAMLFMPEGEFKSEYTLPASIVGALFVIGINAVVICTMKSRENIFRKFPGCSSNLRHASEVDFDMNVMPGKVCCRTELPWTGLTEFLPVDSVLYNKTEKVLVCIWNDKLRVVPGGARGIQPALRQFAIVVTAPQAEELYFLMRKKSVQDISELSDENASCVVRAAAEQR